MFYGITRKQIADMKSQLSQTYFIIHEISSFVFKFSCVCIYLSIFLFECLKFLPRIKAMFVEKLFGNHLRCHCHCHPHHHNYHHPILPRRYDPPNVGVVGPSHSGGNMAILTYDFVHKTHVDIFGFYYPRLFTDWWGDDWVTKVYLPGRMTKVKDIFLQHTLALGQRYSVSIIGFGS